MNYIIFALEMLGIIAFASSGALLAIDKGLDLFGVVVLSVTTATGGGLLRDIILGLNPPIMFVKPVYCIVASIVAFVIVLLQKRLDILGNSDNYSKYMRLINICDAIGLGVFTVVAMNTAFSAGYRDAMFLCVFVSAITGTGGGILRDILVQRTPLVLRQEIYATASIAGAILYYIIQNYLQTLLAMAIAIIVVIAIRLFSLIYKLHLPHFGLDSHH